jgi:hypothetical protein
MSMEAPSDTSTILEPEIEAPSMVTKSLWDVSIPFYSASVSPVKKIGSDMREEIRKKSTKSDNVNVMGAVLFLLLSILVGSMLYVVRGLRS